MSLRSFYFLEIFVVSANSSNNLINWIEILSLCAFFKHLVTLIYLMRFLKKIVNGKHFSHKQNFKLDKFYLDKNVIQ
jgi:hypothetical protein